MVVLDLRTILISYACCNLVCAIVLINLWKQNRTRYAGLDLFMLSFSVNFLGVLLLALRNIAPDFLSIVLGNVFLITGALLLYVGVTHFLGRKTNQIHNYIILFVYIALQSWFVYVYPNIQIRIILFSVVISIYCMQMSWVFFSNKEKRIKDFTGGLGWISILYWLIGIIRITYELILPTRGDLFHESPVETIIYLFFQLIYIILTFYLFIMVNRRLVCDLEEDIVNRMKIETDLKTSQEKYIKVFQSSQHSILVSRMSDGKLIETNDHFLDITDFSKEEILNNSTLSLNFWTNPQERKRMVALMKRDGKVKDFEFDGRLKSGRILKFLLSGETIILNNEECMISYIQDITERKKNEVITKLRLTLWEYASEHTTIELMQKTLDEIEDITGSKIGFFHLVEAGSKNLILQAWSTRTRDKFCKAEGEGMHYPVEKAGVWADSIRQRKAIIHNDYNTLENRKGMPDGHAEVVRELVTPIFNRGKIEAVLGIGNKNFDYDDKDLELVNNIANVVWPIILETQAEEKILQLNKELEELAMVDELTKLSNRRYFFIKGNEEITRSKRYKTPLSMIMLDIDKFKSINDTYGHEFGDLALQCLADTLREKVREVDIIGRLGGEEFGILLPNTDGKQAMLLAERIRSAIEQESCLKKDIRLTFTASLGVAEVIDAVQNLDDLFRNADIAMYQSKNRGRNCITLFS